MKKRRMPLRPCMCGAASALAPAGLFGGAVMWSAAIVYFLRNEGSDWFLGVFAVFLFFTVA